MTSPQTVRDMTRSVMLPTTTVSTAVVMTAIQMTDAAQVFKHSTLFFHCYDNILGCHDSVLNCEYPTPICDEVDHLCKCQDDEDCHDEDYCNTESGQCELRTCSKDEDCNPGDLGECDVSTVPHGNCFYCDTGASPSTCKPGETK